MLASALVVAWLSLVVLLALDLRGRGRRPTVLPAGAVVVVSALAAVATLTRQGLDLGGVTAAFFVVTLVILAAVDVAWRVVPNIVVLTTTPIVLAGNLFADPSAAWPVAGVLLFALFFVAALLNPSGLGMGDVKLAALVGVGCGSATPVAVLASCVLLLCYVAAVFVRLGVSAGRKHAFPFVPFLAAGAIVAVLLR